MIAAGVRAHEVGFDVLRTVAAAAVVMVHVLGPYRDRLGELPDAHWTSAIALNGSLRWCVPIFIMITGALLLSDPRPFDAGYYLRRRVMKVLVPFLWWSAIYALLAGVSTGGVDFAVAAERLRALPVHETYYHLEFFYYFIPLYLLIPPLKVFVERVPRAAVIITLGVWLALTALFLAGADGVWSADPVLFGGYLLLGFVLWRVGTPNLALLAALGIAAVALGAAAVIGDSFEAGRYERGRWFSYKTVNTALAAAFVFALGMRVAERLPPRARAALGFVGGHTLGVYLLHPLFLWPVRAFDLYAGHPLIVIPVWALVAGGLALGLSVLLRRWRVTAWMVP